MPKKKTKKMVAKRCKLTASGKLKYAKAGRGHLLGKKSRKRKRHMRGYGIAEKPDHARIKRMLV